MGWFGLTSNERDEASLMVSEAKDKMIERLAGIRIAMNQRIKEHAELKNRADTNTHATASAINRLRDVEQTLLDKEYEAQKLAARVREIEIRMEALKTFLKLEFTVTTTQTDGGEPIATREMKEKS